MGHLNRDTVKLEKERHELTRRLVKGRDEYADIATERDTLREDLTDLYHTKRSYEDRVQVLERRYRDEVEKLTAENRATEARSSGG